MRETPFWLDLLMATVTAIIYLWIAAASCSALGRRDRDRD